MGNILERTVSVEKNVELTPELAFKPALLQWLVCWVNRKKKHPWYLLTWYAYFRNVRYALIAGLSFVECVQVGCIATVCCLSSSGTEKPAPELYLPATIQPWIRASNFGGDGFRLDDDRELKNWSLTWCGWRYASTSAPKAYVGTAWRNIRFRHQEFLYRQAQLEGMHVVLDGKWCSLY